jgi:hypothetical protein
MIHTAHQPARKAPPVAGITDNEAAMLQVMLRSTVLAGPATLFLTCWILREDNGPA